jgi:hypothetical protein
MAIRRKSDANRQPKQCRHHEAARHERANQDEHEQRQADDPSHDPLASCWCCCADCIDLAWYHMPRRGWWQGKDDDVRAG